MYDDLVKRLRSEAECPDNYPEDSALMREAADAIEKLEHQVFLADLACKSEAAKAPRWIPVTERLPEQNVPCIVYNKDYGPMVGWRIDDKRFRLMFDTIPGSFLPDHPTHWIPLPSAPAEE